MALMVEISNSRVYGLPRKKSFIFFLSGDCPNLWTLNFRKGYYKTAHIGRSVGKYVKRPIICFLKKGFIDLF